MKWATKNAVPILVTLAVCTLTLPLVLIVVDDARTPPPEPSAHKPFYTQVRATEQRNIPMIRLTQIGLRVGAQVAGLDGQPVQTTEPFTVPLLLDPAQIESVRMAMDEEPGNAFIVARSGFQYVVDETVQEIQDAAAVCANADRGPIAVALDPVAARTGSVTE